MKRLIPASLKTWLANNPNSIKTDCFVISLPTGQTLYATEGQWDITIPSGTPGWTGGQVTFRATQYGNWSRGKLTSEASTKCNSNTTTLTCIPKVGTMYPGLNVGVLNAALNHLFDGATVWIYTAYMPIGQYGNVSEGIETKWQGTITKSPLLSRNKVQFECADPMFLLNMKVPSRLMQSNCPWSFADSNCGLNKANYTVDFEAQWGTTTTIQPVTAFSQPDGYFTLGVVTCITGNNAGLSQTVKLHKSGVLTLMAAFVLPINPGDTFAVIRGCDKTPTTCQETTFTNGTAEPNLWELRFGGTPFVPAPTSAI